MKMIKVKALLLSAFFLSPFSTFAFEYRETLFNISTQVNDDVYPFFITFDEEGLISLEREEIQTDTDSVSHHRNDQPYRFESYRDYHRDNSEQVSKDLKNGLVITRSGNLKLVTLYSNDFQFDRGGSFNISYLSNGFLRKYQSFSMELGKDRYGQWKLFHTDLRGNKIVIENLHFITRKFFGMALGIEKIIVNFHKERN